MRSSSRRRASRPTEEARMRIVAVLMLLLATSAWAQPSSTQFPSKPIRIIVPSPAGATTDIIARLVGQRLQESMGQPVLVENRGGAGGSIGADAVAKSAPDGYTILMHNVTFPMASVALAFANRAPYNIDSDFAGISIAVFVPLVITAHPSVPANDLRELAQYLKANPNTRYTYGSTGPGSFMHVMGEAFSKQTRVDMTHPPYT